MAELMRRRIVFTGSRAAIAPATWGQLSMWVDFTEVTRTALYNQVHAVDVPAGLTLDQVLGQITHLINRHESLRTLYDFAQPHGLRQRVIDNGEIEVEIFLTLPTDRDVDVCVRAQVKRLRQTEFDYVENLPIRFMVWVHSYQPRLILLSVSHIVADLQSGRILTGGLTDLLAACRAGGEPPEGAAAMQPIEVAASEQSSAGQLILARSLDYWRSQLMSMPRTMFPAEPGPPAPSRYLAAVLSSPRAAAALDVLAARYRVSTSAVLLGATAALLGRYTGMPRCVIYLLAWNRTAPDLRFAVTNLMQEVPAVIDVRTETFAQIALRAWSAAMRAYRNGRYDKERLYDLMRSVGEQRGIAFDYSCYFNDTRIVERYGGREATAGLPDGYSPGSSDRLAWKEPAWHDKFALEVFSWPGSILLQLTADTCYLPASKIEEFLYSLERLLTELAADGSPSAGMDVLETITPLVRSGRWVCVEDCWVDLDAVRDLIREAVNAEAAQAALEGDEIVGYVLPRDGNLSGPQVRAACLDALPGRPSAVAPQRYVICASSAGMPP